MAKEFPEWSLTLISRLPKFAKGNENIEREVSRVYLVPGDQSFCHFILLRVLKVVFVTMLVFCTVYSRSGGWRVWSDLQFAQVVFRTSFSY